MSFPLQSAGAIVGAAVIATKAFQQIGKAIHFDEILNPPSGSPPPSDLDAGSKIESETGGNSGAVGVLEKLSAAIRNRLAQWGLGANSPSSLTVLSNGEVKVDEHHSSAAEIEALLTSDPAVMSIVNQAKASGASGPWSVDLTKSLSQENMIKQFGG